MIRFLFSMLVLACLLGCNDTKKADEADTQESDSLKAKEMNVDFTAIDKMFPTADDSIAVGLIKTKFGTIEVELFSKDAPKTVKNFIGLALMGYYDGVIFHRVAKGFVIQGGDPTGTGAGGTSIYGDVFEDELNKDTKSYKEGYQRGVLAMANKGPNTNSSQFFIMLTEVSQMPKNYTIFGKVIKGLDVVDKIGASKITPVMSQNDGKPIDPIAMEKVTIEKREKKINSIFDK